MAASSAFRGTDEETGPQATRAFRIYAAVAGGASWGITTYRAATTGITYDEAYTYLHYARTLTGFLRLDIANNHPFNSLLIYLSGLLSGASFSELVIRAPNLLAFGIYLLIAFKLAARVRYPFLAFSLLSLNYYLGEFFGLGRGYGIAAAAVLAALYFHATETTESRKIILPLLLLCVASAAIFPCVVILAAFGVYVSLVEIGLRDLWAFAKRHGLGIAEIFLIGVGFGYAGLTVAAPGRPLPSSGLETGDVLSSIALGFAGMFADAAIPRYGLGMLLTIGLIWSAAASTRRMGQLPFTWLLLLALVVTAAVAIAFGKSLPTGRVLLPFYPLLALAACEWITGILDMPSRRITPAARSIVVLCLSGLLLVNFAVRIHLTYTREWKEDYPLKALMYQTVLDHQPNPAIDAAVEAGNPVIEFYALQIRERIDPSYRVPLQGP